MEKTDFNPVVCIGGGHGLGRLLVSLQELGDQLVGIVATTDNGGSTGRLRDQANTIAWGDLRNCLNQLCRVPSIGQLLFEYRFTTDGDLNGHNLGNLILFALEQMSVRPTDAIQVMCEMLRVNPLLFPMSDEPATLMANVMDEGGRPGVVEGEVAIDSSGLQVEHLFLNRAVKAEDEVVDALTRAKAIILSPGSFMTSVMPSLLVSNIATVINASDAPLILVANLQPEKLGENKQHVLYIDQQLALLSAAGIRLPDDIIWPQGRADVPDSSEMTQLHHFLFPDMESGLHDNLCLRQALWSVIPA